MSGDTGGRFVWYELLTSDPEAAIDFYGKLLGWGAAPFEAGGGDYRMWMRGESAIGGVMELPEEAAAGGAPPHWLGYVGANVDATAERAGELGGCPIVPPTSIPHAGRFAVLQDPQGAVIAVYQSEEEQAPDESQAPAAVSWHELATTDYEAAFAFYSDLFGWEKGEAMDMGEAGIYQMYGRGGPPLGGMFNRPPEMPVSSWLYYITVDDVHASVERVKELGGEVVNGPMEVPGGDYIAHCRDPQGAMFALHSTVHGA